MAHKKNKLLIVVLFAIAMLIGCSKEPDSPEPELSCMEANEAYTQSINDINKKWDDNLEQVIVLSNKIDFDMLGYREELFTIAEEVLNMTPPECAVNAHNALESYHKVVLATIITIIGEQTPKTDIVGLPYNRDYSELNGELIKGLRADFENAWAELGPEEQQ